MRRTLSTLLLVLLAPASLAQVEETPPLVGLITKTDSNPFFVKMKQGALAAAKARGAKLTTAAGAFDGDNAGQVRALQSMEAAGVQAILITPNDSTQIVPAIKRARSRGIIVIGLDSPTNPPNAVDTWFATDNFKAGQLIGRYARAATGGRNVHIAMLDLFPDSLIDSARHDGFLDGFGIQADSPMLACRQDTYGDRVKGEAAMAVCLQQQPDINVVYTINEEAAIGASLALKAAGRQGVLIVSIDGGCEGVRQVKTGVIAATAQQYPLKMAALGLDAAVRYIRTGKKTTGYVDTGVTLITDKPAPGIESKGSVFGLDACWGK